MAQEPDFIEKHKEDIAASLEHTIVDILMKKLRLAAKQTGISHVAVAGGVSANNGLRAAFADYAHRYHWTIHPEVQLHYGQRRHDWHNGILQISGL